MSTKFIDLTGQRFGRLIVINRTLLKNKVTWFFCRCDCGKEKNIRAYSLKCGDTISCGCFKNEQVSKKCSTHRMSKQRIYSIWEGMINRCENPHNRNYKNYGKRGINVCDEWHSFESFFAYMGHPPTPQHTIERINNYGNYEPGNCKWATRKEQGNNTRRSLFINFNGQHKTLSEWAELLDIKFKTLYSRLKLYGWPLERALTTPVRKK
jgi:hypothetical protein